MQKHITAQTNICLLRNKRNLPGMLQTVDRSSFSKIIPTYVHSLRFGNWTIYIQQAMRKPYVSPFTTIAAETKWRAPHITCDASSLWKYCEHSGKRCCVCMCLCECALRKAFYKWQEMEVTGITLYQTWRGVGKVNPPCGRLHLALI